MEKYNFSLTESVRVGKNSPTALNVLIGANCEEQYWTEREKIDVLNKSNLPISIITDLSLYKKPGQELWRQIVKDHRFVASSVPVYQAVRPNKTIDPTALVDIIQEQAEGGVKLITIHPTPDLNLIEMSKNRIVPITSRGGAAVSMDMLFRHANENVYIRIIDDILKIVKSCCMTLSIGTSFRSANLHDAMDQTYLYELKKQLEIANYCNQHGVNIIIETPGHASPQKIFSICDKLNTCCPYPIMPLGPMPTDCALNQDDLAASIGAVLMGTRNCADILSVVTKAEHTGGIPTTEAIISALKKYSVAKHIIDIYKLNDTKADDQVSLERSNNTSCILGLGKKCNRCGALCPLNLAQELKLP